MAAAFDIEAATRRRPNALRRSGLERRSAGERTAHPGDPVGESAETSDAQFGSRDAHAALAAFVAQPPSVTKLAEEIQRPRHGRPGNREGFRQVPHRMRRRRGANGQQNRHPTGRQVGSRVAQARNQRIAPQREGVVAKNRRPNLSSLSGHSADENSRNESGSALRAAHGSFTMVDGRHPAAKARRRRLAAVALADANRGSA